MRTTERPVDFVAAALVGAAALGARALLHPWLGPMQPFASGFVAIAAAVLFFGWRPAVVTAVLAYVGGTYFFTAYGVSGTIWPRPQDVAALVVYSTSAGLIIFMGHRVRLTERKLADANEQLRQADRRKDEFLATLSHELRNPIGVITTAASVLEASEQDPRRRSTIALLVRQAAQVRRLVDDLLDVGRITRGRLTLHPEPTDLRVCVDHAIEAARDLVQRKQQSLVSTVPDRAVELPVDSARMVQVLSNLIDNASKYSPAGADIRVTLCDGTDVVLDVTDTGPGIDHDILPNVFDIFDQGGSSASGGLGLGLGLCKRIVEMHGGTIVAGANPDGQGTSFVIRLPKNGQPLTGAPSAGSPADLR